MKNLRTLKEEDRWKHPKASYIQPPNLACCSSNVLWLRALKSNGHLVKIFVSQVWNCLGMFWSWISWWQVTEQPQHIACHFDSSLMAFDEVLDLLVHVTTKSDSNVGPLRSLNFEVELGLSTLVPFLVQGRWRTATMQPPRCMENAGQCKNMCKRLTSSHSVTFLLCGLFSYLFFHSLCFTSASLLGIAWRGA